MWRGLLCLIMFSFSGCGLILAGREQTVRVETLPTDALLTVPDLVVDVPTPAKFKVPRTQSALLQITKPGYSEKWVVLDKEKSQLVIIADILLTGPIGVLIDWRLGTWHTLSPSKVVVTLDPIVDAGLPSPVGIQLADDTLTPSDPSVLLTVHPFDSASEARQYLAEIGAVESE